MNEFLMANYHESDTSLWRERTGPSGGFGADPLMAGAGHNVLLTYIKHILYGIWVG